MRLNRLRNIFASIALLLALASGRAALAHDADTIFHNSQAGVGARVLSGGWDAGKRPCFRMVVRAQALDGSVEVGEVVISSEALFQFEQQTAPDGLPTKSLYVTVGALEAMLKGQRVGLGFQGVTLGEDEDRSFQSITRTGVYLFLQLLRSEALALDIRSGYEFERKRVLLGEYVQSHDLPQQLLFSWSKGRFSGEVGALLAFAPMDAINPAQYRYGGYASVQTERLFFDQFRVAVGAEASYEYDPFREQFGLDPNLGMAGVFIDASYIPRRLKKSPLH